MSGPPTREHDEGFTLTELLVTVVIIGIIVAVLCAALVSGVRFGPQVSDRTSTAVDTSFLIDRLSDDVANAARHGSASGALACDPPASIAFPSLSSVGGASVAWTAHVTRVDASYARVDVRRVSGTDDQLMLTGLCANGRTDVVQASWSGATFTLTLELAPRRDLPAKTIVVAADRRTA